MILDSEINLKTTSLVQSLRVEEYLTIKASTKFWKGAERDPLQFRESALHGEREVSIKTVQPLASA